MIINKGRQTGKTHDLIIVSHYTGFPIIVTNYVKKDIIINQAKDMGYDDIPVFTVEEWWKKGGRFFGKNQVLVDDAEVIMERALGEYIDAEILAATVTLPIEEVKNNNE